MQCGRVTRIQLSREQRKTQLDKSFRWQHVDLLTMLWALIQLHTYARKRSLVFNERGCN